MIKSKKQRDILAGVYEHYKGKQYLVLGLASHSETLERFVVYAHLYPAEGTALWVRPVDMFFEDIEIDGVKKPRFKYLGSTAPKYSEK